MNLGKRMAAVLFAGALAAALTACGTGTTAEGTTKAAEGTAGTTEGAGTAADTGGTAVSSMADTDGGNASGKIYQIGILQLTQHTALDKTNEGFVKALDDSGIKYKLDQQNASNDQSACMTIAQTLVDENCDLIFAIATPAAQAVAGTTDTIPIIISAVTDPAQSGLVNSNEKPGVNVSGTSDLTPVKAQIDLLRQIVPKAKTVGLLYSSAESNSVIQIKLAKQALDQAGIAYKDYSVSSSNEIQSVVESMVGKVDAIYAPTDNMIASGMATVGTVADENKIPVICGESGMVDAGGLATYGIDYYKLGYMAGEQAVKVLTGKADISSMPIEYQTADQCELHINQDTAKELGLDLSGLSFN